jgi:hypothetical protein
MEGKVHYELCNSFQGLSSQVDVISLHGDKFWKKKIKSIAKVFEPRAHICLWKLMRITQYSSNIEKLS